VSDDGKQPVGEILGDAFLMSSLPPKWTILDGMVILKCLDADGQQIWAYRISEGLSDEEAIGMLTVQLRLVTESVVDQFLGDDSED
jgi:hypothetical protein